MLSTHPYHKVGFTPSNGQIPPSPNPFFLVEPTYISVLMKTDTLDFTRLIKDFAEKSETIPNIYLPILPFTFILFLLFQMLCYQWNGLGIG